MIKRSDIHLPDGSVRKRTISHQKTPFLRVECDEETGYQLVRVSDSAALLIYVVDWHKVLLISQVRPALISAKNPSGMSYEMVAGRLDYKASVQQILANEALEEAGVAIPPEEVFLINGGEPLSLSGGVITELQYLGFAAVYSCQIELTDRVYGVAAEHEKIHREFVPVEELANRKFNTMSTFALVQWFLQTPHAKERRT